MKTRFIILAIFSFFSLVSSAQDNLYGFVSDTDNHALEGVRITIQGTTFTSFSDKAGKFEFKNLKAGAYTLIFGLPGYFSISKEISALQFTEKIEVKMASSPKTFEEVQVISIRSIENATSTSTLQNLALEKKNFGQDIPLLLEATPSVVTTSDAGAGVGYTGVRIRGVDASRINVTINSIPINDPESHDVYWVNMPDLASSIETIQIQRGVGTSTNGAAAFGASINIKSQDISTSPFGISDNSVGSFNTLKTTIKAGTGLINDKFSLETRLSKIASDGFLDRASSALTSYYISGSYLTKKSVLKAIVFSGKEITYQAWYGTPESRINGNIAEMNAFADRNYLSDEDRENLLNSGRAYNFYTYKNEVDNYQQDNYQVHFTHSFKPNLVLNIAGHYTYGRGYYEQYRKNDALSSYGLPAVIMGKDTISTSDLIRRKCLDNDFIGAVYSLNYNRSKFNLVFGGAINTYFGRHFGEIIWARMASTSEISDRYYENNAQKSEFSTYLKGTYRWNKFDFTGDLNYRHLDYSFLQEDQGLQKSVVFDFFNPKGAITFKLNRNQLLFASYGISHREPVRKDFVESSPSSRPKFERMQDLELGYSFNTRETNFSINTFYMAYSNQLVLTGQINDVGAYTRTNAKESYRLGVELMGIHKTSDFLKLNGSFSLSQNKIAAFEEYSDNYSAPYSQVIILHKNTDLAFSPSIVANAGFSLSPVKNCSIAWLSKYVGRQFLDNTSNVARSINPFTFSNLSFSYSLLHVFCKEITFAFQINNVFNALYENNGYTYSYLYDGETTTENFYYPQAGRNFIFRILLKL